MIDEQAKCDSCQVPLIEHLGVVGTCARLQEALLLLDEARKTIQYSGLQTPNQTALVTDEICAFLSKVRK